MYSKFSTLENVCKQWERNLIFDLWSCTAIYVTVISEYLQNKIEITFIYHDALILRDTLTSDGLTLRSKKKTEILIYLLVATSSLPTWHSSK